MLRHRWRIAAPAAFDFYLRCCPSPPSTVCFSSGACDPKIPDAFPACCALRSPPPVFLLSGFNCGLFYPVSTGRGCANFLCWSSGEGGEQAVARAFCRVALSYSVLCRCEIDCRIRGCRCRRPISGGQSCWLTASFMASRREARSPAAADALLGLQQLGLRVDSDSSVLHQQSQKLPDGMLDGHSSVFPAPYHLLFHGLARCCMKALFKALPRDLKRIVAASLSDALCHCHPEAHSCLQGPM